MMIYAIQVLNKRTGSNKVSQVAYKTLKGAEAFIKSRSDYNNQPMQNWQIETDENIYIIKDLWVEGCDNG